MNGFTEYKIKGILEFCTVEEQEEQLQASPSTNAEIDPVLEEQIKIVTEVEKEVS